MVEVELGWGKLRFDEEKQTKVKEQQKKKLETLQSLDLNNQQIQLSTTNEINEGSFSTGSIKLGRYKQDL